MVIPCTYYPQINRLNGSHNMMMDEQRRHKKCIWFNLYLTIHQIKRKTHCDFIICNKVIECSEAKIETMFGFAAHIHDIWRTIELICMDGRTNERTHMKSACCSALNLFAKHVLLLLLLLLLLIVTGAYFTLKLAYHANEHDTIIF